VSSLQLAERDLDGLRFAVRRNFTLIFVPGAVCAMMSRRSSREVTALSLIAGDDVLALEARLGGRAVRGIQVGDDHALGRRA